MYNEAMQSGRTCCIDFGLKRIGLALSNPSKTLATKLTCLENKGFKTTQAYLEQAIKKHNIESFVVGWPILPSGDEGKQCKLVDNFCKKLYDAFELPIIKFDERYSTVECQYLLQKSKVTDDKVATLLLQSFLDQNLKV